MTPFKSMRDWYYLRDGFESFRLEPERHRQLLFGKADRKRRDQVLDGIEEAAYSLRGHKAVLYGDYGRGKTQQSQNLIFEAQQRELPVRAVYVKCVEYGPKEPFSSLMSQMLGGLPIEEVRNVAQSYQHMVRSGEAEPIDVIIGTGDVSRVFPSLQLNNDQVVRLALKWLGGEKLERANLAQLDEAIPAQITVSRDFAAAMKGIAHMYREVLRQVIVFLIDEADLLKGPSNPETSQRWTATLRALTELNAVGYIFFVGANNEDEIPQMLVWDEVRTRIGAANYWELPNPGQDRLTEWVLEFFQTLVRKGQVPEPLRKGLGEVADDTDVPQELLDLVGDDPDALEAYPFTKEALEEFVEHSVTDPFANKPREMLDRIDRAAGRAMRLNKRLIDVEVLESIRGEESED